MSTKQYNNKKNQKQTQETKHNIVRKMFKVKRGRDKDKTLINNLKQPNFNFNVQQNYHLAITVKAHFNTKDTELKTSLKYIKNTKNETMG